MKVLTNQPLAAQAADMAIKAASRKICESTPTTLPKWVITAMPYLKAIRASDYGLENPTMCVLYALNNLTSWRGEEARGVKGMLNNSMKDIS